MRSDHHLKGVSHRQKQLNVSFSSSFDFVLIIYLVLVPMRTLERESLLGFH